MRKSGVLLPIFSLPSNYGIGTFGKEAFKFVDFLEKSNQGYWQILPLGPTSYGDSPYQSFSIFAGNPYFIDLDLLCEDGLLDKKDIEKYNHGDNVNDINYGTMYVNRYKILKEAYINGKIRNELKIEEFKNSNKEWIVDYALFMSLKDHYNGASWSEWPKDIKSRNPEAIEKYKELFKDEINFYIFIQYLFEKQWTSLKEYANSKGIEIIGDIPIYVAADSADTWVNPKFFMFDEELNLTQVAGCPPDAFSETGQLWGNPIYNWQALKEDDYKWWIERVKAALKVFDVIRIDHFRGFESYWCIPYGEETAINGSWEKGPGFEVFKAIKEALGEINIIAEDLGYITPEVRELLEMCNFPGMKVLQFAFDPSGESDYLPHNYEKNTVVYTGTHDNDTIKGWFNSISYEEKEFCKKYTGMENANDNWKFIRCAMASVANTSIVQMQDILNLGQETRINIPSTLGTNWRWRMMKDDLSDELAQRLGELTKIFNRK